jgi:hypothetical protein
MDDFEEEKKVFREMNAEVGIEMTPREAEVNYAACTTGLKAVSEFGWTIDEAIEGIQKFAGEEFHPGVCRKFLTEAMELMEEQENYEN